MSKKDFEQIADILSRGMASMWIISHTADYCATTNPRFDRDKFIRACCTRTR